MFKKCRFAYRAAGPAKAGRDVLSDALNRRRLFGTSEFYVSGRDMLRLLRTVFGQTPGTVVSLNRPQTGGSSLVHRIEWDGMVFTSVSRRPFVVT